ncbi:MAG: hypothetical protein ACOYMR_05385 [Ilumatobacteraceae bacterium]
MNDPARLARLNAIKLAALVREHLGDTEPLEPGEFARGAALRRGTDAWVLVAEQPERGLGPALAWALRQGAAGLHVIAESGTGLLARRAVAVSLPVTVWHAEGRTLVPAVPEPLPEAPEVPVAHREFADMIAAAGAEPREEFGVLFGEVAGLEVCRVVDDPYLHVTRLEVGVGAHDREAFQTLHGDRPAESALADVVRAVTEHRSSGLGHPLSRLAGERMLRSRLVVEPSLIGAAHVEQAPPPVPRTNLKDAVPCCAVAVIDGTPTAVVCSSGVDLDAIPFAVDARTSLGLEACVVVMPSRDAIPLQHDLAALVEPPISIVPVD